MESGSSVWEFLINMIESNKRNFLSEGLYVAVTSIFLFFLNKLNQVLVRMASPLDMLSYNGYQAVWYFFIAIILVIVGVILMIYHYKTIRTRNVDASDVLAIIVLMIVTVIMLFLILVFINNPILRAIIMVVIGAGLLGYFFTSY